MKVKAVYFFDYFALLLISFILSACGESDNSDTSSVSAGTGSTSSSSSSSSASSSTSSSSNSSSSSSSGGNSSSTSASSSSSSAASSSGQTSAPLDPFTAVADMGVGINLGNTLDAPEEGAWALSAKRSYITAFKQAGFKHVRVPVTWDAHVQMGAPYSVAEARMDRVEEVINWVLEDGLYAIVNAHHEDWLKKNYAVASNRERFDAIWRQISKRFKDKSPKLIFEILNEPKGMTASEVDELNVRILGIIREQNPNRLVVFSGSEYTSINELLNVKILNDPYLIGNFHSYDPWSFAGQCTSSWGTQADKNTLENIYKQARDWSTINGIPVTLNEFGVAQYDWQMPENKCDLSERIDYLRSHVSFAKQYGLAQTFWDDGGSFASFDRSNGTWGPEKDVLTQ